MDLLSLADSFEHWSTRLINLYILVGASAFCLSKILHKKVNFFDVGILATLFIMLAGGLASLLLGIALVILGYQEGRDHAELILYAGIICFGGYITKLMIWALRVHFRSLPPASEIGS